MNKLFTLLFAILLTTADSIPVFSQKAGTSAARITASDLESHVSFLASPLLKGRMNGEEGLDIAAQYIISQVRLLGLKPANGNSFLQPYLIEKKSIDKRRSKVQIFSGKKDSVTLTEPVFQLFPAEISDLILEGEVVFAGYGLKLVNYNDFENLKTDGKILLIMDSGPPSENGKGLLTEETNSSSFMSIQSKISPMLYSGAKAILIVANPKSGFLSLDGQYPEIAGELGNTTTLKGEKQMILDLPGMPAIVFIHRSVADELLKGTGHSLEVLQKEIDNTFKPNSFKIPEKKIRITLVSATEERTFYNVAALIEGNDPVLKNEIIIFSGHYDHIGSFGEIIKPGADDDASGCAALLSLAEAFQSLGNGCPRSLLFLWVSGEEIGLFGSKSYVKNPLFPLKNTVVNLNMDMIGRTKGIADSTADTPMTGLHSVFVITANQSKELRSIADDIDKKSALDFDYSLSGKDHPLQLFSRSDHFNFVENDIPVLFFTTGLHSDYHTPGDIIEKIDFVKMEMITRTVYEIGFTIANRKTRLLIDNPYSSWGKSK